MFAQKLSIAFVATSLATLAVGQSATVPACSQPTATINSQADVTALASCSTFAGSIVVSSNAAGTISIDGPQQVGGGITCENAGGLTSLGSTTINAIGGEMKLNNLTLLSTLSMGSLTSVQTIMWQALPALSSLTFPAVVSKAESVTISNTFLSSLAGIDLTTVKMLQIDNNNRLKTFTTQVANVTQSVNIVSNGNSLNVSFPNLIWAANMTMRNVSSIMIPSLAVVNGSLGFYGNYFESVMAPNLTTVGNTATGQGSMALVANGKLANISMPMLKSVGGANQIANNTALQSISFPKLAVVGGAIDFSGNFSTPELPALTNVKGGFNIQSTANIDCSGFKSQSGNVIQGTFICKTTAEATTLNGSGGSGSGTGTGSSPTSTSTKGAAASFGVSQAVAGLSVIGGLVQMIL